MAQSADFGWLLRRPELGVKQTYCGHRQSDADDPEQISVRSKSRSAAHSIMWRSLLATALPLSETKRAPEAGTRGSFSSLFDFANCARAAALHVDKRAKSMRAVVGKFRSCIEDRADSLCS
jgi:hypothetical protein